MNSFVEVTFPSGAVKKVYPIRVLVQAQNAEFKAKFGMFLPGVGKQHPTVRAIREEYEMDASVKRWDQVGPILRKFLADLNEAIRQHHEAHA